jgi:hypothetical protein
MADLVLDPETMSMDDLRKAADAQAAEQSTKKPEEQQEEVKETPTDKKEVSGPFYSERTIDLGDGAGVQVFKGKGANREEALEDLTDKLAEAQRHASKKIRELSKTKPVEKTVSKEDEALYSAELLASPTVAFKKLFESVTGIPIEKLKTVTERAEVFQEGQQKKSVADQFISSHPDYLDNDRNGKLINKWLTLHNDFSSEGFEKAYTDLAESGLLQVKDGEASVEQKKTEAEAQRIADAAEVESSQRTRKGSGLSTQRRSAAPPPAAPTEEDMEKMSLDDLRKLANQQLAGR